MSGLPIYHDESCRFACVAELTPRFAAAMQMLNNGLQYAQQTSGDRWEFAVEIDELFGLGLTRNDLRWLVRMNYVEHAREVTHERADGRAFCPTGDLTFRKHSCFVLTSLGEVVAGRDCSVRANQGLTPTRSAMPEDSADECLPQWDTDRRELRVAKQLVKRFKWHAINQETILVAFQEEGWPHRIDDPLAPKAEQDSKRRLNDTIKCLNRKQQSKLIRFRGDGTGEGVVWEHYPIEATA